MKAKQIATLLLLASITLGGSGCMTTHTVGKARGPETKGQHLDSQPAYYLLVPFAFAADVVTSPFQLLFTEYFDPRM